MKLGIVNKILTFLIIYYVSLVILTGLFGSDVVADIARIAVFYGVPLVIVFVLFVVSLIFEIGGYLKSKSVSASLIFSASGKMIIAVAPMFVLDDTLASLLVALRVK